MRRLLLTATLALTTLPAGALDYGFDTDEQGWTAAAGATLSHVAAGGNPGGYLQLVDTTNEDFVLVAPLGGDLSAFLGGSIAFDAINLNGETSDYLGFGLVTLSGAGQTISADPIALGEPPADGQWHRYTIPLTTALWGAALPAVLANVSSLTIEPEFHIGVSEIDGVDNIAISPVPEAAPWLLALAGVAALAAFRRFPAPSSSSSSPPLRSGGCARR